MPKTLMLTAILLLSAAWLQAQQDPQAGSSPSGASPTSSQQADSSKSGSSSGQSVEGCVQGSSGNFTLTDKSGTTYQLAGDTSKLSEYIGHEVEIKGSTSQSSPTAAGGQQTLTVESVKHKSKTCKMASGK